MWCVLEIFVFLEMGGERSKLQINLLDEATLHEVQDFNAKNARCFTDEDTERLQKVLEVTGYKKIDKLVHSVFCP